MARPKKAEEDRLSENLPFRVTSAEADQIFAEAAHQKLSVSAFLRTVLRDGLQGHGIKLLQ